jgi:hypothetical protein
MAPGDAEPRRADEPALGPQEQWPDALAVAVHAMPPLALLSASAGVSHLMVHRVVLPLLLTHKYTPPAVLLLLSPFLLNLAAAAGLLALISSSVEFVRARDWADGGRRLVVAGLASVLVSTVGLSMFAPVGQVTARQVLVATGAAHTMAVQLALSALRQKHSLSGRVTAGLVAAACMFPLVALLLRQWDPVAGTEPSRAVASLYGLGELAFLLEPIAAAFVVIPWGEDARSKRARAIGAAAVVVMGALFAAAARLPDAMYGHVLYATLRLEWALERASLGYAVPVSLAAGCVAAALASHAPRHRQGGVGVLLWLVGGYNPLSPIRLLLMTLGAMLICRAVVSAPTDPQKSALR